MWKFPLYSYRISQTFLLIPNFHWIIVEDAEIRTPLVTNLLAQSGLSYTHLNAETPKEWKLLLEVIEIRFRNRGVLPAMTKHYCL